MSFTQFMKKRNTESKPRPVSLDYVLVRTHVNDRSILTRHIETMIHECLNAGGFPFQLVPPALLFTFGYPETCSDTSGAARSFIAAITKELSCGITFCHASDILFDQSTGTNKAAYYVTYIPGLSQSMDTLFGRRQ